MGPLAVSVSVIKPAAPVEPPWAERTVLRDLLDRAAYHHYRSNVLLFHGYLTFILLEKPTGSRE